MLEVISHVYVCLSYLFCLYFYNFSINFLTCFRQCGSFCFSLYTGADPGFQVRGGRGVAHLKKLRRAEGSAKIFGVFRVKNHDFMPKIHIFSNFRGGGGGEGHAPGAPPPGSAPDIGYMLKMIRVDFLVPGDMVPDTIVQANLFLIHNTSYTCTMMTD